MNTEAQQKDMDTRFTSITRLEEGAHPPDHTYCAMEAVAYIAGERWSDEPQCASRVLAAYTRVLNDLAPDGVRQRLLTEGYVLRLVGTRNPKLEKRRAYLLVDHAVRVFAPLALHGLANGAAESLTPMTGQPTAADAAYVAYVARAAYVATGAADVWNQALSCLDAAIALGEKP